jgi:hypothetical protein
MGVRWGHLVGAALVALGLVVWAGDHQAGGAPAGGKKEKAKGKEGHSHERGKMLIADAGKKYPALLTAHLSKKDGNELDIFFETADDKKPTPVAFPLKSFKAQVKPAEGPPKEVVFECAPANERPKGEKPGTCSHFVAKVPWMKATDSLYVVVRLKLDGEDLSIRWRNFNPKKYAHHED